MYFSVWRKIPLITQQLRYITSPTNIVENFLSPHFASIDVKKNLVRSRSLERDSAFLERVEGFRRALSAPPNSMEAVKQARCFATAVPQNGSYCKTHERNISFIKKLFGAETKKKCPVPIICQKKVDKNGRETMVCTPYDFKNPPIMKRYEPIISSIIPSKKQKSATDTQGYGRKCKDGQSKLALTDGSVKRKEPFLNLTSCCKSKSKLQREELWDTRQTKPPVTVLTAECGKFSYEKFCAIPCNKEKGTRAYDSKQLEPKHKPKLQVEPMCKLGLELESKCKPKLQIEPMCKPELKVEPKRKPELQIEPMCKPELKLEPKLQIKPMCKLGLELESKCKPKSQIEPMCKPELKEPKRKPELQIEPMCKPQLELESKCKSELQVEPMCKPQSELESKCKQELQIEPMCKPELKLEPKLQIQPMSKPKEEKKSKSAVTVQKQALQTFREKPPMQSWLQKITALMTFVHKCMKTAKPKLKPASIKERKSTSKLKLTAPNLPTDIKKESIFGFVKAATKKLAPVKEKSKPTSAKSDGGSVKPKPQIAPPVKDTKKESIFGRVTAATKKLAPVKEKSKPTSAESDGRSVKEPKPQIKDTKKESIFGFVTAATKKLAPAKEQSEPAHPVVDHGSDTKKKPISEDEKAKQVIQMSTTTPYKIRYCEDPIPRDAGEEPCPKLPFLPPNSKEKCSTINDECKKVEAKCVKVEESCPEKKVSEHEKIIPAPCARQVQEIKVWGYIIPQTNVDPKPDQQSERREVCPEKKAEAPASKKLERNPKPIDAPCPKLDSKETWGYTPAKIQTDPKCDQQSKQQELCPEKKVEAPASKELECNPEPITASCPKIEQSERRVSSPKPGSQPDPKYDPQSMLLALCAEEKPEKTPSKELECNDKPINAPCPKLNSKETLWGYNLAKTQTDPKCDQQSELCKEEKKPDAQADPKCDPQSKPRVSCSEKNAEGTASKKILNHKPIFSPFVPPRVCPTAKNYTQAKPFVDLERHPQSSGETYSKKLVSNPPPITTPCPKCGTKLKLSLCARTIPFAGSKGDQQVTASKELLRNQKPIIDQCPKKTAKKLKRDRESCPEKKAEGTASRELGCHLKAITAQCPKPDTKRELSSFSRSTAYADPKCDRQCEQREPVFAPTIMRDPSEYDVPKQDPAVDVEIREPNLGFTMICGDTCDPCNKPKFDPGCPEFRKKKKPPVEGTCNRFCPDDEDNEFKCNRCKRYEICEDPKPIRKPIDCCAIPIIKHPPCPRPPPQPRPSCVQKKKKDLCPICPPSTQSYGNRRPQCPPPISFCPKPKPRPCVLKCPTCPKPVCPEAVPVCETPELCFHELEDDVRYREPIVEDVLATDDKPIRPCPVQRYPERKKPMYQPICPDSKMCHTDWVPATIKGNQSMHRGGKCGVASFDRRGAKGYARASGTNRKLRRRAPKLNKKLPKPGVQKKGFLEGLKGLIRSARMILPGSVHKGGKNTMGVARIVPTKENMISPNYLFALPEMGDDGKLKRPKEEWPFLKDTKTQKAEAKSDCDETDFEEPIRSCQK